MNDQVGTENLISGILFFIRDHWALVASIGYLYLSIMGMSQAYFFYHSFGINVFEFSELNDFALAAFKEPKTLLYGLGMLVYVGVASLAAQLLIKRREERRGETSGAGRILKLQARVMSLMVIPVALAVPFYLPHLVNDKYSDEWKCEYISNPHNAVLVKVRVSQLHNLAGGELTNLSILGTTDKFSFFYSRDNNKVLIIPISNVLYVEHS